MIEKLGQIQSIIATTITIGTTVTIFTGTATTVDFDTTTAIAAAAATATAATPLVSSEYDFNKNTSPLSVIVYNLQNG